MMVKKRYMLALGIILLSAIVYLEGPDKIIGTFSKADIATIIFGELLLVSIMLIKGYRFGMIASKFSRITLSDSYKVFCFGQVINQGIASAVGDASKAAMLNRQHGFALSKAIASVVIERMFDFTMILLLGSTLLLSMPLESSVTMTIALFASVILSLAAVVLIPERYMAIFERFRKPYTLISEFRGGVRRLKATVLTVSLLTAAAWLIDGAVMMLIFKSLGVEIPFMVAASIMAISIFIGFASMIPGGIGVREASMVLLYSYFGISGEFAVASALIYRVMAFVNDYTGYAVAATLSKRTSS